MDFDTYDIRSVTDPTLAKKNDELVNNFQKYWFNGFQVNLRIWLYLLFIFSSINKKIIHLY